MRSGHIRSATEKPAASLRAFAMWPSPKYLRMCGVWGVRRRRVGRTTRIARVRPVERAIFVAIEEIAFDVDRLPGVHLEEIITGLAGRWPCDEVIVDDVVPEDPARNVRKLIAKIVA
jgi:hypothetical protein